MRAIFQANPFVDRLCAVFSSQRDEKVSFEDMIDLFSALSPSCPTECKAKWAFRIFGNYHTKLFMGSRWKKKLYFLTDFNNSNALEYEDLYELIDRLTNGKVRKENGKYLSQEEKDHITDIVSI